MVLHHNQLSKAKISGYKSIKDCTVEFNKINVLIGSNGAGKSNFISAFALLQNVLSKSLQLAAGQSGINGLFYNGTKTTDELQLEVFFGENSYGFELVPTEENTLIFKNEFFGYYGKFETRSKVAVGHAESKWETGTTNQPNSHVIPILNEHTWRVYHFHDTSRSAKVKLEHDVSNNRNLMFDASNLAAFLFRLKLNHKKSYNTIVQTIQLIAPYFHDFVLEPRELNDEKIILLWQQKGCEDVFNASQLSDGTIRFICLATLLLQPEELQPTTIIIDEPELGLHPYAITIFSELVKHLPEKTQIIISTQSVELLNEFNANDVVVVDRSSEGSHFKRLNYDELHDWIQDDYSLGDLWKKNVLGGRLTP